ncbi:MAG: vWA domain-containing protein [Coriobacteriia bacterium]|nr:vWA domain-containing protein [Coriobacteriia bacterium]
MVKKLKLAVAAMLSALLIPLAVAPLTAVAADTDYVSGGGISKSKEATNLDENYVSNVTLSLPAADYKGDLDVVFVLDGSTSTDKSDLAGEAAELLKALAEYQNLNVKAGVIVFGGSVPILYTSDDLLALSESTNLDELVQVITDKKWDGEAGRSGSNLQAGVKSAQKMLDADTSVASSDKYLIILSDGGARTWMNDDDKPMSQVFRQNNANYADWGQNQDYASRYVDAGKDIRTFKEVWQAGNTYSDFAKYAMPLLTEEQKKDPDVIAKAANWETVCQDQDSVYYPSLEVATYYAATSIIEASQNSQVLWIDYAYHDGKYQEYTDSFKSWLASNGYVTRYNSAEATSEEIFSGVKDQLIYLLDAGSTVDDYMGYVEGDYNFDLVNDADALVLTVGGEQKATVKLGENSYGFGDLLNSGVYEYELTYYPANDGEEHFRLTVNVPVTKDKPVKLSYKVKLTNPKTTGGTYGVYDQFGENNDGSSSYGLYTNNKATLNPVDSTGKKGESEDFNKPTVSYTVPESPSPNPTPTPASGTPAKKVSVPRTGDTFNVASLVALLAVGAAAVGTGAYLHKKQR